jgi:hypothetical protein
MFARTAAGLRDAERRSAIWSGRDGAQKRQPAVQVRSLSGLISARDERCQLRIIDVKLTSEPGPHYFAEFAHYAVALAAWLREHGLDRQYVVSSAPAVWPGSEK